MAKTNPGLFYGILCGVSMSAWVLLEFAFGFHTTSIEIGQYSGYFSIIFPIVYMYLALHSRQVQLNNTLPIVEGINTGFRLSFFCALVLTLFFYVYNAYINPEWINTTIEWQRKRLILGGATDDEIGRFMEENRTLNGSLGQTIMGFISAVGIGVLITLIEIPLMRRFSARHYSHIVEA
jgi:hypothetical protein